jgi:cytochrome b561
MKYNIMMRILHWVIGLSFMGILAVGFYMTNLDPADPNKYSLYPLHKSFGVLLFMAVIIRIAVRIMSKVPAMPKDISKFEKIMAHSVQYAMYVLMLLMPLSGYLMSDFAGFPVKMFGIELYDFFATNKPVAGFFRQMHGIAAWGLVILIGLHFLGAIRHRYFDKKENDVLQRML